MRYKLQNSVTNNPGTSAEAKHLVVEDGDGSPRCRLTPQPPEPVVPHLRRAGSRFDEWLSEAIKTPPKVLSNAGSKVNPFK